VAPVERFEASEVVLVDGIRLQPDAVICATGYGRGLEPIVGHLGVLPTASRLATAARLSIRLRRVCTSVVLGLKLRSDPAHADPRSADRTRRGARPRQGLTCTRAESRPRHRPRPVTGAWLILPG